ncbi:flagellar assembly peptidoglycan hydrolase FlgJ [Methylothermus subterraneus]
MRATADIYTEFSGLGELKRLAQQDQGAALKEAAKQFEAVFVQMLLKQMREASPGDPIFASDQTQFYRELHDRQLALHLAEHGGLGLAAWFSGQLQGSPPKPTSAQDGKAVIVPSRPDCPSTPPAAAASNPGKKTPERFESAEDFVRSLWPEAQAAAAAIGLDPKLLLAQAALETGWGKRIIHHPDGRSSYNLFNIKADPSWPGEAIQVNTLEYQEGVAVKKRAAFRAYENYRQSFADYLKLIQSPRYTEALKHAVDPDRYLNALAQAGYATDPNYAAKVLAIYQHETLAAL